MAQIPKKFLDAAGVQHLADKLNDYPTNELLGTVIDAIGEELEAKVDSDNLAQVAFTGEYEDINNVPMTDYFPTNGSKNLITSNGVYHALKDVREAAEGKRNIFVVDTETMPEFNSNEDNVSIIDGPITDIKGIQTPINKMKIGDVVYITNTGVPDRWLSDFLDEVIPQRREGYSSQPAIPSPASPVDIISDIYYDRLHNPIELRGINSYKDTYENGILTRRIGVYTFSGEESFETGAGGTLENYRVFRNTSLFTLIPIVSESASFYCTHFKVRLDTTYNTADSVTRWNGSTSQGMFCISEEDLGILPTATKSEGATAFAAWLMGQLQRGTPVKIYYPLKNPTTEEIVLYAQQENSGAIFNKMETSKPPVLDVKVNNTSVVSNSIADISFPSQQNADWNATDGVTKILNKPNIPSTPGDIGAAAASHTHTIAQITDFPTLGEVATSDDYNDLKNTPNIATTPTAGTGLWDANTIINYIASRGQQLITNGTALLGNNYNFSSFTFDGSDNNSSGGCFIHYGATNAYIDELISIDPKKLYRLTYDLKPIYDFSNSNAFLPYLRQFDSDKLEIYDYHTNYQAGTLVQLTEDLKSGDTIIHLTDVSSFANLTSVGATLQFWDYQNSGGYLYAPGTYTRHTFTVKNGSTLDLENNTIILSSAYTGSTIPAETYVSQNRGGGYAYIGSYDTPAPGVWTSYTHNTTSSTLRKGCAYISIGWLWNYSISNSKAIDWDDETAYNQGQGVKNDGKYYITLKPVPAGTSLDNTDYFYTRGDSLAACCKTKITNVQFTSI